MRSSEAGEVWCWRQVVEKMCLDVAGPTSSSGIDYHPPTHGEPVAPARSSVSWNWAIHNFEATELSAYAMCTHRVLPIHLHHRGHRQTPSPTVPYRSLRTPR